MNDNPQTWHYGLVARYWAEHITEGPEIAYFQKQIERGGQPALDAGCGTGRLLIPFLQAGLDVDGCDLSADMLALCRERAAHEGLHPTLFQQALYELNLPRSYQTIVACGVLGLGATRQQDFLALQRFYEHLKPGGLLALDHYLPYSSAREWRLWQKEARNELPEPWPDTLGKNPPEDGSDYELHSRIVAFDPLEQQVTRQMRTLEWRGGQPVADETYQLTENFYFFHELGMLFEQAGFEVEAVQAGYSGDELKAEDDVMVFLARRK